MHPGTKIYELIAGSEYFDPFIDGVPKKLNLSAVYIIDMKKTPFLKIGCTTNIRSRITQLQSATPFEARCAYLLCPHHPSYVLEIEKRAHDALADKRLRGEWFEVDLVHAIEAVRGAQ